MSVTQNWSWIFSMNSSLYNQLRSIIFSKVVPPTTVTPYEDSVITLNFNPVRTSIALVEGQTDTVQITSQFNGNIQPNEGVQTSFSGSLTASIDLDKLYIQGDGASDNTSGQQGITWTNYLYLSDGVISELTVDTGDADTDATLTAFMQDNIDSYIASSPHSLGEMSSENLDPYFVPTYQKFITLTDDSNSSNPRMVLLVMVNNEEPPTSDPHDAFNESDVLNFPDGGNAVFAFNDYTFFDFMSIKMEENDSDVFSDISVSQNPAVLTAKGKKKNYSLTLKSQIANDSISTSLNMTNAINANVKYGTSFEIVDEEDGSQSLEITNDLTGFNTSVNMDNDAVIGLMTAYAAISLMSPLSGVIFFSILITIEQKIISMLSKAAHKLEFDKDLPLKSGTGSFGVEFMDITLDEGVVIGANISVSTTSTTPSQIPTIKVKQMEMPIPKTIDEGIHGFSKNMDKLHTELTKKKHIKSIL